MSNAVQVFVITGIILLHSCWVAAQAQESAPPLRPGLILVRESDCRWLVRHRAEADVTYQPGVDVNGESVPAADLVTPPAFDLDVVSFDLLRRPATEKNLLIEGQVGTVAIDVASGAVSLNGQPLTPRVHRAVVAFCARQGDKADTAKTPAP